MAKQTTEQILEQLVKEGGEHARRAAQEQLALIKAQRAQELSASAATRAAAKTEKAAEQLTVTVEEERAINNAEQFRGAAGSYASSPGMGFGGAARIVGGTAARLGGNMFDIMFPTLSKAVTAISTAFNQSVKDYQDQKRENEAINEDLENVSSKLDILQDMDNKLDDIAKYLKNLRGGKKEGSSLLNLAEDAAIAEGAISLLPEILTAIAGAALAAGLGYLAYKGYEYLTGDGKQALPVEKPPAVPTPEPAPEPTMQTPNADATPTAKPAPVENNFATPPAPQSGASGNSKVTGAPLTQEQAMSVVKSFDKPVSESELREKAFEMYGTRNLGPAEEVLQELIQNNKAGSDKQGALQTNSLISKASYGDEKTLSEKLSFKARDMLFNAERMIINAQNFGFIRSNQAIKSGGKAGVSLASYDSNAPSANILGLGGSGSEQSSNLTPSSSITPNLDGGAGPLGYGGGPGLGGNGSTDEAISFFMSNGWTREQAAGIVGNLQAESGSNLQLNATGDGGQAYGIAQWHPDRQAKFQEVIGKPIRESNFQEQLRFVQWELTNTEKAAGYALAGATTAEQAAEIVDRMYERSAGGARGQRINNATALMKADATKQAKTDSGSGESPTPSQPQGATQKPSGGGGAQIQPATPSKGSQLKGASESMQSGGTGDSGTNVMNTSVNANSYKGSQYDPNMDSNNVGPVWISMDLEREIYGQHGGIGHA